MSFFIDAIVDSLQVGLITIFGFVIVSFMAYKDLAVDGWTVKMLHKDNVYIGTLCQSFGYIAGMAIGANAFLFLNSVSFCNQYIWPFPKEHPLLNHQYFLLIMGGIYLSTGFIVHCFLKEGPEKNFYQIVEGQRVQVNPKGLERVKYIFQRLWSVLKNRNYMSVLIMITVCQIGVQAHRPVSMVILQRQGFEKEKISFVNLIGLPVAALVTITGTYLAKIRKEVIVFLSIVCGFTLSEIWLYSIVSQYRDEDDTSSYHQLIGYTMISGFFDSLEYVTMGGFSFRIAEKSIGASMVTLFNALSNLSKSWPKTLSITMLSYLDYWEIAAISLSLQLIFIVIYSKEMIRLSKLDREDYSN